MDHQRTIRLTGSEYAALQAEAKEIGEEIEDIIHRLLAELCAKNVQSTEKILRSPSQQKVSKILYHAGLTSSIPTGESPSKEEEAELKRLADLFGPGKPASEMVIEDRELY